MLLACTYTYSKGDLVRRRMAQTGRITTLAGLVLCLQEARKIGLQMALNGFLCSEAPSRNCASTRNGALRRTKGNSESLIVVGAY